MRTTHIICLTKNLSDVIYAVYVMKNSVTDAEWAIRVVRLRVGVTR